MVKLMEKMVGNNIHPGSLEFLNTELNSAFRIPRLPGRALFSTTLGQRKPLGQEAPWPVWW